MKHFLKAAAVVVIVMIVNIAINMICNTYGVELNSGVTTAVSLACSLAIYHGLIRNEKE